MRPIHSLQSALFVFAVFSSLATAGCAADGAEEQDVETGSDGLHTLAAPVDVADLAGDVLEVMSDGTDLFTIAREAGTVHVKKISKWTGASSTLASLSDGDFIAAAMDANNLYVLSRATGKTTVSRVAKLGGGAVVLPAELPMGAGRIAVDATHLYWLDSDRRKIERLPKSGIGFPVLVADAGQNVVDFAMDGTHVYWADIGAGNPAIGCNAFEGIIRRAPKSGGIAQDLAFGESCPLKLEVDGAKIYWSTLYGELRSTSTSGGFVTTAAKDLASASDAFSVSGGRLAIAQRDIRPSGEQEYVIALKRPFDLAPSRFEKTRSEARDLAPPYTRVGHVAVDATSIFYVHQSTERVDLPDGEREWHTTSTLRRVNAL